MPAERVKLVGQAYAARSTEYVELFGSIEAAAEGDRAHVLAWARGVSGRILDVGCGPGQWTGYLHEHGVKVAGIDPVQEFVDSARRQHPGVEYQLGDVEGLAVDDASIGGVLAWFSLIHASPDEIDALLTTLRRWLRPGGSLLVGFFEGADLAPFAHAVTTAYRWPAAELCSRIERAGFVVTDIQTRADPGERPQGTITARRSG